MSDAVTETPRDSERERDPAAHSLEARERLIDGLRLDLVGPGVGHELAEEMLHRRHRPSNWYLTGFLIPADTQGEARGDGDSDEDFEDGEGGGNGDEGAGDRKVARKSFFPSSMGLSFLVAASAAKLEVVVRWGDYVMDVLPPRHEDEKEIDVWRRHPREKTVEVDLAGLGQDPVEVPVPDSGGAKLTVLARSFDAEQLGEEIPKGTRSVSVFLVNGRVPQPGADDTAYIFQPQLVVKGAVPFVPRPDLRGRQADDSDERVADLHFADAPELATGHGVSVDWDTVDGTCRELRTEWIPRGDVERTVTAKLDGVELGMGVLGALADGRAARTTLTPLVDQYREWIEAEQGGFESLSPRRKETAEVLLLEAGQAANRIAAGIEVLATDEQALDAFKTANRAVARALRQRLGQDIDPAWRAFQLAFLLLNVEGVAQPTHPQREIVDLLFFPTGGGKTEAYLGLAAYTMVLRRLRRPGPSSAGVSVLMRYTLRLLTLDQLGRAAGLVCALELERLEEPDRLGEWPFEIGLWVGKAATPNVMGRKGGTGAQGPESARSKTQRFQSDPKSNPSPIPLENCPWCNHKFEPDSFELQPNADNPQDLRVVCTNLECDFNGDLALPILAVDEVIYRRLPAFLISTVDKFASLPFTGETGLLMGGATRSDGSGFYGPMATGRGTKLETPLPPTDLVIQDELHLISGPMGTMAGLYETALEALALHEVDAQTVRPKIVASTATARKANDQVRALFARAITKVFPPPGLSRRDSFFAKTLAPTLEDPARSYIGLAAQGRNPKVAYRRLMTSLMATAQNEFMEAGGYDKEDNVVDPYMTVLSYFNSLRELGGSRRILEEEVRNTLKTYGKERSRLRDPKQRAASRRSFRVPIELTSRVTTAKVAAAKRDLEADFTNRDQRVDCALATNMISVGLDITRLGLMVVVGQPKTHSEYIQASSRVGRDSKKPGLVITLLNVHKPRDRSHYERFRHYHETFYRSVEAATVTPFSARALDRGLAGALVGLMRHEDARMTPSGAPSAFKEVAPTLRERAIQIFQQRVQRAVADGDREDAEREVRERIEDLSDSWLAVVADWEREGKVLRYQKFEGKKKDGVPLVREMLDEDFRSEHHRKFRANRSLRDVEPAVKVELHEYDSRNEEGDD